MDRRAFLGALLATACARPSREEIARTIPRAAPPYPFARNPRYALDRPLTEELVAAAYNNFYELGGSKDAWRRAGALPIDPWTVEVTGLVARPRRYSIDDLLRLMPHEERVYRLRCVEAWSMAVPWSGFPLHRLLRLAEPTHAARFVRFVSFTAPGAAAPFPYVEGLRLDEAMHDLTFVATGIYGHALPKQHGAPVRIVVPWKYGYKSPKSVVRIELVAEQPHTFWETLASTEYPFESNVDPSRPHPRWAQATEKLIGTWDVRRTVAFNGYGAMVAQLYA